MVSRAGQRYHENRPSPGTMHPGEPAPPSDVSHASLFDVLKVSQTAPLLAHEASIPAVT